MQTTNALQPRGPGSVHGTEGDCCSRGRRRRLLVQTKSWQRLFCVARWSLKLVPFSLPAENVNNLWKPPKMRENKFTQQQFKRVHRALQLAADLLRVQKYPPQQSACKVVWLWRVTLYSNDGRGTRRIR